MSLIEVGFLFLGGAVALGLLCLTCGLCHMDTAPRTVKTRGQFVDMKV